MFFDYGFYSYSFRLGIVCLHKLIIVVCFPFSLDSRGDNNGMCDTICPLLNRCTGRFSFLQTTFWRPYIGDVGLDLKELSESLNKNFEWETALQRALDDDEMSLEKVCTLKRHDTLKTISVISWELLFSIRPISHVSTGMVLISQSRVRAYVFRQSSALPE